MIWYDMIYFRILEHGNKKNLLINSFLLFNCNCNLKKSKLNYKTDSIDIAAYHCVYIQTFIYAFKNLKVEPGIHLVFFKS